MNARLRALVLPADKRGLCVVCGGSPCTCAPIPNDLDITEEDSFWICEFGGEVKQWVRCDSCRFLIGLTKHRPAVRCPHCSTVN